MIHIDQGGLVSLNKTCRYCPDCELLIAHQDEIESHLASLFATLAPKVIGNDYMVVGTLDRPDWKRGVVGKMTIEEIIEALHDFKDMVRFELSRGWMRDDSQKGKVTAPQCQIRHHRSVSQPVISVRRISRHQSGSWIGQPRTVHDVSAR